MKRTQLQPGEKSLRRGSTFSKPPARRRTQRWTRDELIAEFRRFYETHGRPPSWSDWRGVPSSGWPAAPVVQRMFGSWMAGITAAGLEWVDQRTTGEGRACEACGGTFYATAFEIARGARFCSQRCMGNHWKVKRLCRICGTTFVSDHGPKLTCSAKCATEAQRRSKLGRRNPNWRSGICSREGWFSAKETACRQCGSTYRLHLHHVVYAQHVRQRRGDVADPANALTLCFDCHMAHHGGSARVSISRLRPENFLFAMRLLRDSAPDYFRRYYAPPERHIFDREYPDSTRREAM
jgi:hypothetical protein